MNSSYFDKIAIRFVAFRKRLEYIQSHFDESNQAIWMNGSRVAVYSIRRSFWCDVSCLVWRQWALNCRQTKQTNLLPNWREMKTFECLFIAASFSINETINNECFGSSCSKYFRFFCFFFKQQSILISFRNKMFLQRKKPFGPLISVACP